MKTTATALTEAVEAGELEELQMEGVPYFSHKMDNYELAFEPLLWGNMMVGLYRDGLCLLKIPVAMILRAGDG